MSGPSSPWRPCACAPSSVTQWFLYRTVLITVLFVMASSSDWCNHLQSDFTGHVQTIGPLDGRLWAITTEWTVHEMTPCDKGNETLSLCMEIGFPVQVDTKWPELAKSVKENANVTDYNFTVDNSVFMNSTDDAHVLVLHGASFKPYGYFGFNFSTNGPIEGIYGQENLFKSLWISSDEKDQTFRVFDAGQALQNIKFSFETNFWELIDVPGLINKYICNVTKESELSLRITTDKCDHGEMDWTVLKTVRYRSQFYFFAPNQVYIFAAVENVTTRVDTVHYGSFIHCKESAILEHNLSNGFTTIGSNKKLIFASVGVIAIIVMNVTFFANIYYQNRLKSSQKEVAQPGCNSKASSKVNSTNAGQYEKAISQANQSKAKRVLPVAYQAYPNERYLQPTMVTSDPDITLEPAVRFCKTCQIGVTTRVEHQAGYFTWLASLCLLICGCCIMPFFLDWTKDIVHLCPNCSRTIGQLTRIAMLNSRMPTFGSVWSRTGVDSN